MKITVLLLTTFLSGSVLAVAISFPTHAQQACDSIGMTQASRGTRCIKSLNIDTGKTMSSVSIPFDYSAPSGWIITNYQLVTNSTVRGNATVTNSTSHHLRGTASAQSHCKTQMFGKCVDRHGGWWNGKLVITLEKVRPVAPPNQGGRLGTKWYVNEGGEWIGEWIRQGNSNIFNASQRSNKSGQTNTFMVSIDINGNNVNVRRFNSSDGNDCNYSGTISGNVVSGTYFCKNGGPFQWQATIQF